MITTGHPQILAGPNNLSFNHINSKERRFLIEAIPDDTSFLTKIFHYWNLEQMGPTCRISVISAPGKSPSFRTCRSQSLDRHAFFPGSSFISIFRNWFTFVTGAWHIFINKTIHIGPFLLFRSGMPSRLGLDTTS